jgi:hypothetical protein
MSIVVPKSDSSHKASGINVSTHGAGGAGEIVTTLGCTGGMVVRRVIIEKSQSILVDEEFAGFPSNIDMVLTAESVESTTAIAAARTPALVFGCTKIRAFEFGCERVDGKIAA